MTSHENGRLRGPNPHRLSTRESETLRLIAHGLSNEAIAAELYISPRTVEAAIHSLFLKLRLSADGRFNRRVQAAALFWEMHHVDRAEAEPATA